MTPRPSLFLFNRRLIRDHLDASPPAVVWRTRAALAAVPWPIYRRVFSGVFHTGLVEGSCLTNTYGYPRPRSATRRAIDVILALTEPT